MADPQPGHYDGDGHWVIGLAAGYYDTGGHWVPTSVDRQDPTVGQGLWAGAPGDLRAREAWLEQRIRAGMNDGSLSRDEARRSLRWLNSIRNSDLRLRRSNGELSDRDQTLIRTKLDKLSRSIRWARDKS